MRLQACLHTAVETSSVQERWIGDPWFFRALEDRLGDIVKHSVPVDRTPKSSLAVGARWYEFGDWGRLGLIPVSDGTDLVLEIREGVVDTLRERLWRRHRKRMVEFLEALDARLKESGPKGPGHSFPDKPV